MSILPSQKNLLTHFFSGLHYFFSWVFIPKDYRVITEVVNIFVLFSVFMMLTQKLLDFQLVTLKHTPSKILKILS